MIFCDKRTVRLSVSNELLVLITTSKRCHQENKHDLAYFVFSLKTINLFDHCLLDIKKTYQILNTIFSHSFVLYKHILKIWILNVKWKYI